MEGLGGLLAGLGLFLLFIGAFVVFMIASVWKVNVKAGQPGWAAIVPVYGPMVLAEIGGKPNWWGILTIIPFVGIIFWIMICIEVAKSFGKGTGFGVCMFLFAPICWPILGFGSAQYIGPGGQPAAGGYPAEPQPQPAIPPQA